MQEDLELVDFVCIIADMQSCRWKLEICYRRYNREQEAELSPLKRCRIWSGVIDEERPDWQSGQRKKTMLEASRPSRSRPLRWPRGCRIPATSRGKGRRKRDRIPRKGRKSRLAVGETAKKTGLIKFKNNVTQWRYERQKVCGDAFILHRLSACCKRKRQSVTKKNQTLDSAHPCRSHRFASRRAKFFYQTLFL